MNEKEIAEKKVIPYLENLGWSKQLITEYGRVPVQMGTEVKYADVVALFVDENDVTVPYLVVEIKQALDKLDSILAQAESYTKLLDAWYFLITDGKEYIFYQRRPYGEPIRINNVAIPEKHHLTVTEKTIFKTAYIPYEKSHFKIAMQTGQYGELAKRIDEFFNLIIEGKHYLGSGGYSLRNDIAWHYSSIKGIHNQIFDKLDFLNRQDFLKHFSDYFMCKLPNQNHIKAEVEKDFNKVKSFLKFIKDFQGDPEENLDRLFNPTRTDRLHINGIGPFVTSQFLAGAHPREYAVIEDRMVDTMKSFKLIDVRVNSKTPNGYMYINEMCRKLFTDIFKGKLEENKDKLGFRIDEDFNLILMHEFFWEYDQFQSYDASRLEEVTGIFKENLEKDTARKLEEIIN